MFNSTQHESVRMLMTPDSTLMLWDTLFKYMKEDNDLIKNTDLSADCIILNKWNKMIVSLRRNHSLIKQEQHLLQNIQITLMSKIPSKISRVNNQNGKDA